MWFQELKRVKKKYISKWKSLCEKEYIKMGYLWESIRYYSIHTWHNVTNLKVDYTKTKNLTWQENHYKKNTIHTKKIISGQFRSDPAHHLRQHQPWRSLTNGHVAMS
jgi:hypothetical protein